MARPSERTIGALTDLAACLREVSQQLDSLAARATALAAEVATDRPLSEVMAGEERPLIITQLVEVTDRLHDAGGKVRRAEAHQLRDEGRTQEQIAESLGVTRQRVAALLRPVTNRPPKRPRRT